MEAFVKPIRELESYEEIEKKKREPGIITITGCMDTQKPHLIHALGEGCLRKLIVTFEEQRARELLEEYHLFEKDAVYYPAKDILFYQSDVRGNLLTVERMRALRAILENKEVTVITTFDALMNTMIPPKRLKESVLTFAGGQVVDIEKMTKRLVRMGYQKEFQVESAGQFAVRGGIIDIFPLTEENPVRMELWGDEIDIIRVFDAESQKSFGEKEEVIIYPVSELVLSDTEIQAGIEAVQQEAKKVYEVYRKEMKTEEAYRLKTLSKERIEAWGELSMFEGIDAYLSYFLGEKRMQLLDYFSPQDTLLVFDELHRGVERGNSTETEFAESMERRLQRGDILPGQMKELFSVAEILGRIHKFPALALASLNNKSFGLHEKLATHISVKSVNSYGGSFELLIKELGVYIRKKYRVILLSGSRSRAQRIAYDLLNEGFTSFYTEDTDHDLQEGQIMVCYGKLRSGFEYPMLRFALITDTDIFGTEKKKKKKRVYEGEQITRFTDLSVGDYVVHEDYGLGIYKGIEQLEIDHTLKDYIKIEYAGNSNLYISVTQLDVIQKYADKSAKPPKLNRIGGQEWKKTRSRVRGAVQELAQELVQLYAAREQQNGFVFAPDTVWQKEFEELFPFEETEDQLLAIEATKQDMESKRIMDRLVCGDVGFGKTEIAIRAAFKAVMDGKQVAYLAPTTILAQQIYNTFSQRMKDFPINVDLLCRFRSAGEQKKTIEKLKKKQVDIIIGTHRILSKDVVIPELGLLVIDEEQRFGVAQKEKIKQRRVNVDVLTLTATPIPRTLHMNLIGIRDMSVLEEPPMDRQPIQTYVLEYNEEMVREAIQRELARDGQIYYVFNRVKGIQEVTAKIQSLVPQASVAYAHGQMKETELEKIMYRFINGEIDVLVSTTIIETGLDISNVNTMIIHDADQMGLSQLYQLRGRIGRSSRTAYAFLMYRRDKMLKEIAEKRLAAIREFSDLGSGFRIAMRDLELRGAGNLLGAEQSGQMEAVGYDLYCKMLHEAVQQAKGETPKEEFETKIDLEVDAYIPTNYISNEFLKLDIYKRIAGIETQEESSDMLDELIDRFGEPPKPVLNLLEIARIKGMAHELYMTGIEQQEKQIRFQMFAQAKLRMEHLPDLLQECRPGLKFLAGQEVPSFSYQIGVNGKEKNVDVLALVLGLLEKFQILRENIT